ncbi:unnamed protein product [Candidula unifasciata]|uniref:Uncharacterized protein n=1 Tax=Candidula unifasciata TaxID=100452 RepID=A0A8S3ZQX3_9EUPU|nr:unnamed protein product [Candidula unifasciata]
MYVPVFQGQVAPQPMLLPSKSHMRSISCQVTTIEESSEEEDVKDKKKTHDRLEKPGYDAKSSRSDSLKRREGKDDIKSSKNVKRDNKVNTDDGGELKRSSSVKVKNDKSKAVAEVKLKTSDANKGKEKGEKTSLFAKLFSRKKKHKDKDKALMPPPPPPPPRVLVATPSSDTVSEGKGEKEYGTFSAQFPPPEWVWYHQQLEKQKRIETWVCQQSTKVVSHTQSVKVTSRPPTGIRQVASVEYHQHGTEKALRPANPEVLDYIAAMNSAGGHKDGMTSTSEVVRQVTSGDFAKPHPLRPDRFYHSLRNPPGVKHHMHHRKSREFEHLHEDRKQSEYAVIDQDDASTLHESNVIRSVSALSPVAHISDESTYTKLIEPKSGPLHSTPRYEEQTERATHRTDGLESKDKIYGPSDYSQRRKSHRTRRRPHRMYSYYDGNGDDISYEYKGRLPNKNSSRTHSKDSGVNCVGLAMPESKDKRQAGAVYETASCKNVARVYHGRHHPSSQPQTAGNHVHFMINSTTASEATNANVFSAADSATNSLIYQSDMTNPAYNSVVYCSSITDAPLGSSVVYHTITNSNLESTEMHLHHNSLQSAFYSETGMDLISLNAMACKSEIDRIASQDVVELHSAIDTVVVGSVAEDASGVSEQVISKDMQEATSNTNVGDCKYEDGKQSLVSSNSKKKFGEYNDQIVSAAETALDSENKHDQEGARPGACSGSDANTQAHTQAALSGQHADIVSDKFCFRQWLNQNVAALYHTAARIVPHPDAYNNNTASIMYIEQKHRVGMPLPGHILAQPGHQLAQQRPQHKHPKRERPHSVDLWKSSTPSELHKFEEEQLSKKYGEFEVMGVL